eukprot:6337073-Pyramimonas_sp.AAC.1
MRVAPSALVNPGGSAKAVNPAMAALCTKQGQSVLNCLRCSGGCQTAPRDRQAARAPRVLLLSSVLSLPSKLSTGPRTRLSRQTPPWKKRFLASSLAVWGEPSPLKAMM